MTLLSVSQLWDLEREQVSREFGKEPDPELWRWSPLDIPEFARMLTIARGIAIDTNIRRYGEAGRLRRLSLAEAGSGIGTKGYLAEHHFGMDFTGYEINDEYLTASRELGVNVVEWDLRESQPPWADYDIVYIARPFKDDGKEIVWEQSVMDAMRPGTVLISAYAAIKPYTWDCYYRRPFRGVWAKPEPSAAGVYTNMIHRTDGPDPLIPQPGPRRP